MDVAISARKRLGSFELGVNVIIGEGTTCVIGPNASGKTTLLRVVGGVLKPDRGYVKVDGVDVYSLPPASRVRLTTYISSTLEIPPMARTFDVVSLGRTAYGIFGLGRTDLLVIHRAVEELRVERLVDRYFRSLSDGERQRALIAMALATEAKVLALDEPTTHLDPTAKHHVIGSLSAIARGGRAVIISLHDLELLPYCDLVLAMRGGMVVWARKPHEIDYGMLAELFGLVSRCEKPVVHVFGGWGRGTPIYWILRKLGICYSTGILYEGDVDVVNANRSGGKIYVAPPIYPPPRGLVTELSKLLREVEVVIDSGFPLNQLTQMNYELLMGVEDKAISLSGRVGKEVRLEELASVLRRRLAS